MAVLATTEDVTHHLGVAADGDNGAVGKGKMFQEASRETATGAENRTLVGTEVFEVVVLGDRIGI